MPHEIIVPRLGWSMEEGTFGEWLKRDGDSVQPGEPLFVLEGEKSAQDIEAIDGGILRIPADAPRPGDTVRVGQVLGYLVAEGEPLTDSSPPSPAVQQPQAAAVPAPAPVPAPVAAAGSPAPAAQPRHAAISPRARRLANQLGIDSHTLPGSGRTGRIRERDVRSAAERLSHVSPRAAAGTAHATQRVAGESATPWLAISTIRKTIAARMSAGVHEAAPVTLTTRCDAANLVNLREQFRGVSNQAEVPSYNDLLLKLTAAALARHPQLTYQWHERGLYVPDGMHIALAIDTEAGLFAPVLRDVDRLSLRQVTEQTRGLIERARAGGLGLEEMQGGVFTITNLGMYGVDAFTPIINLPQSAILGIGRIVREPAVVEEVVVPRAQLILSLTFDHRVVDGAPAGRFLQTLRQAVEAPGAWLLG